MQKIWRMLNILHGFLAIGHSLVMKYMHCASVYLGRFQCYSHIYRLPKRGLHQRWQQIQYSQRLSFWDEKEKTLYRQIIL